MKKTILLILMVFFFSSSSIADQLLNTYHVKRIFAESSTIAGFYAAEGLTECKWGIMYIDLSKEAGKAQFSIVLTAKTVNQTITRMDYTVNTDGACSLTGIHLE